MWKAHHTTSPIDGNLKALLATGIATFQAELKPHCVNASSPTTGIRHFDNLTREQQIMAIHEIGVALLRDDVPPPKPAAYLQAAMQAVLDCIERNIVSEILENANIFRTLAVKAHRELYGSINHGIDADCTDTGRWHALIMSIRKKLLDEWTLEISDKILDLPPGLTSEWLRNLKIPQDYLIAVPGDPAFFKTAALAMKTYEMCANYLLDYSRYSASQIRYSVLNN